MRVMSQRNGGLSSIIARDCTEAEIKVSSKSVDY